MHVVNCEHPIRVYNKHIHDYLYVPCGKCPTCQNRRAKVWIDKLTQESRCWKFTYFVNLDYSDEFIPRFVNDGMYLVEAQERFKDLPTEKTCIPLSDFKDLQGYEFDYMFERLNSHYLAIPHPSVYDIQCFKKRFNKYCHDKITGKYGNFRSFIVSEIGPTTHRAHYHGLFFFNDVQIAERFNKILSECWPYGHATGEPDAGYCGSYVAQYVNRPTDLPAVFAHSEIRPFALYSKQPPLGSLLESEKEIQEVFNTGSVERVTTINTKGTTSLSSVPLSSSIKNRLFPKCPHFESLPDSYRTALYRFGFSANGEPFEKFEDFKFFIRMRFEAHTFDDDFFMNDESAAMSKCSIFKIVRDLSDNALLSLYRIQKRIYTQAKIFGCSYDYYISRILLYYQNSALYRLKKFYEFQEQYVQNGGNAEELIFMYPEYVHQLKVSYGKDLNIARDCAEFRTMRSMHHYIFAKSHKTMKKNAYFEKLKFTDNVLYQIINNYSDAKKRNEIAQAFPNAWQE